MPPPTVTQELKRIRHLEPFDDAISGKRPAPSRPFQKLGSTLGKFTNQRLLPGVVSAGVPVLKGAGVAAGTLAAGPIGGVLGGALTTATYNKFGAPYAPKGKNSAFVNEVSSKLGGLAGTQIK